MLFNLVLSRFFSLTLIYFVFFLSTAEVNLELSRPLKVNPTLIKLEQAKAYLQKVLPNYMWESSSKTASAFSSPHSSPKKTPHRAFPSRLDPQHESSSPGKASKARNLSFHKVSLLTKQIVVVMETDDTPMRPSVSVSVSAMTACLVMKLGPRIDGKENTLLFLSLVHFSSKMLFFIYRYIFCSQD